MLNRPVSILVSAPETPARCHERPRIATGERASNVQILDLGNADGVRTYLVTNEAQAPDLLDLVIQRDGPYVEPFFTDTSVPKFSARCVPPNRNRTRTSMRNMRKSLGKAFATG